MQKSNILFIPQRKHPPSTDLPIFLTPLLGREQELAAALHLLRHPDVRLLTVVGTAGIGKTRLSQQIASEAAGDFEHGVCIVSLASIRDPELVLVTIAQALELEETGNTPVPVLLKSYLQEQSLLLLLDNFEQVIAAAPYVTALLAASPRLKVVVTSREALCIRGEQLFPLKPLAFPDAQQPLDLSSLTQYAATALFLQRAQAHAPDVLLTEAYVPMIVEICSRLEGIPLALELAAARLRLLSPQQLLARLYTRLHPLTGLMRDLPERQQTIHHAIQWSYDLLNREEQKLFRRISLFAGGCTLETLEALYGNEGDMESLTLSLLNKSLLYQTDADDEPRLAMLEPLREYGQECLLSLGEMEPTISASMNYYLFLAEKAAPELRKAQQALWLNRLEREWKNFRAVLGWMLERHESEMALRVCHALWWFWYIRSYHSEGREWLEQALEEGKHLLTPLRAAVLHELGTFLLYQDKVKMAEEFSYESLELFRHCEDAHGEAIALHKLAMALWAQGQHQQAYAIAEQAQKIFRELGDQSGIGLLLIVLGTSADHMGSAQGQAMLEEGLSILRHLGEKWYVTYALNVLANIAIKQKDVARARLLLEESLVISQEIGYRHGIAIALRLLAQIILFQGDAGTARSLAEKSLAISQKIEERWGNLRWNFNSSGNDWSFSAQVEGYWDTANVLSFLASVASFQGDMKAAQVLYEESRSLLEQWQQNANVARDTRPPLTPLPADLNGLTSREIEVLRFIAAGLTSAQIAERLVVSTYTINAHLRSIYSKLAVSSRVAAARYALENHLI